MKKTISRQLIILLCLVIAALAIGMGANFLLNQKFFSRIEEEKRLQLEEYLLSLEKSFAGLPDGEFSLMDIEEIFYPVVNENHDFTVGYVNRHMDMEIVVKWSDKSGEPETRILPAMSFKEFDKERDGMRKPEVTRERDKIRSIRPLFVDGNLAGAVWIEDSIISDVRTFAMVRILTGFAVLFSCIIGFFGAVYIIRKLMRDINRINEGIGIMKGDLGHRISATSGELGQVAVEINAMAEKLEERKALEEKLHQADKLASLGQFVSGIAHELRNPLGIMKGSLQLMEREGTMGEEESKFLKIVYEQIERQNLVIEELLKFAKPAEPNFEELEIDEVIDSIMSFAGAYLRDAGIELHRERISEPAVINGDREKLKQVFLNLILNAAQAMPGGGTLSIKVEAAEGEMVQTHFRDSGDGIPEKDIADIFNPYYTTKDEGTGLGLSISYKLVQLHDGTIEARNIDGGGAEFSVSIPVKRNFGGENA